MKTMITTLVFGLTLGTLTTAHASPRIPPNPYAQLAYLARDLQIQSVDLTHLIRVTYNHAPWYSHLVAHSNKLTTQAQITHNFALTQGNPQRLQNFMVNINTTYLNLLKFRQLAEDGSRRGPGHVHGGPCPVTVKLNQIRMLINQMEYQVNVLCSPGPGLYPPHTIPGPVFPGVGHPGHGHAGPGLPGIGAPGSGRGPSRAGVGGPLFR